MKHCALGGLDGVHQQTGFLRPECLQCSLTMDLYTKKRRKEGQRKGHLQGVIWDWGTKPGRGGRWAEMGLDIIRTQSAFWREYSWHPGLEDLSWGSCKTFFSLVESWSPSTCLYKPPLSSTHTFIFKHPWRTVLHWVWTTSGRQWRMWEMMWWRSLRSTNGHHSPGRGRHRWACAKDSESPG